MAWGKYYLIRHLSKREDPIHGQKREHVHFKIHLEGQKSLSSYVIPSKKLDQKKKTFLIYIGRYEASSALTTGQIVKEGIIDKIGQNEYTIDDKFIIKIYQTPAMKQRKEKMFFVSYRPLDRPEKWWKKYRTKLGS